MAMTALEKLLANAANKESVKAGEIITVEVNLCMINDSNAEKVLTLFEERGKALFNKAKVIFAFDHDVPSGSIKTAKAFKIMKEFSDKHGVKFHNAEGVGHQILLDKYVLPGQVIVTAGQHGAVYGAIGAFGVDVTEEKLAEILETGKLELIIPETVKVMLSGNFKENVYAKDLSLRIIGDIGTKGIENKMLEFYGRAFEQLTLNDKITLCNLASRTGAVTTLVSSENDGVESGVNYKYNLSEIEPQVAFYEVGDKVLKLQDVKGVKVHQVFIGGCSNGRIEDLRIAAEILKGKKVKQEVRAIVSPVTNEVYIQALEEGLIDIFLDSDFMIMNPGCSVCWGMYQGLADKDEVVLSAGSRNQKGCVGNIQGKIYLASAAVAAASAIVGEIVEADICVEECA